MYEVTRDVINVNKEPVELFGREVIGETSIYLVSAGTTGLSGSNERKGGARAYMKISCPCGDFFTRMIIDEDSGKNTGVKIACCGDDAIKGLIKSLEFTVKVLKNQVEEVDD